MLPTPDYSHLKDFPNVYDPCEDTFLLLDALEADLGLLKGLKPEIVIEIGCGSGVVINFLSKHLSIAEIGRPLCIATDINSQACQATRRTAEKNGNDVEVVNCDLLEPLADRLERKVDLLVFNPPYVVTERGELGSKSIEAAWAGGLNGREVMDRVFPLLDRFLSPSGVFYLVCIKPNNVDDIQSVLHRFGFDMQVVLNRKAGIENLFILRFQRIKK